MSKSAIKRQRLASQYYDLNSKLFRPDIALDIIAILTIKYNLFELVNVSIIFQSFVDSVLDYKNNGSFTSVLNGKSTWLIEIKNNDMNSGNEILELNDDLRRFFNHYVKYDNVLVSCNNSRLPEIPLGVASLPSLNINNAILTGTVTNVLESREIFFEPEYYK